ncbi:MAG: helix-turn-helix domain-containing protein [Acetatifactor sp.]|nr:helix-turn-helix domain-containing protein [Acetatifactor sp.]
MTTGEKIAMLRKRKNITQEQLAEILGVSRQSVSRWEMDQAFPETEKLIRLSGLFSCSIDFLLSEVMDGKKQMDAGISADDCVAFIRECGYFFLATSVADCPRLRPFGMIFSDNEMLYIITDKQKSVYSDLKQNAKVELASFNPVTRKWIRISGNVSESDTCVSHELALSVYPTLRQKYPGEQEVFLAIYQVHIEAVSIN